LLAKNNLKEYMITMHGFVENLQMPKQVIAYTYPFDRAHDTYQEYYRASLTAALSLNRARLDEKSASLFPSAIRKLRTVKDSYRLNRARVGRAAAQLAGGLARLLTTGPVSCPGRPVGRYLFKFHGFDVKVVVDSNDPGTISRPDLLDESDIYFKTNYRQDINYSSKVHPLPNANPLVLRNLWFARALRSSPVDCDLFAFFRIWGGSNELEGIEHNIALFESLARINCRKQLTAYLVCGDFASIARRLERVGVACRTEPMPLRELWTQASRSRLHVVRHGMHDCVPWRMMDVLALGGCPLLDFAMSTRWPLPLIERQNYLHLNAQSSGYASVPRAVEGYLQTPGLIQGIRANNAQYFEKNLSPTSLGQYICSVVANVRDLDQISTLR
jgi:hypothetical protein